MVSSKTPPLTLDCSVLWWRRTYPEFLGFQYEVGKLVLEENISYIDLFDYVKVYEI